MDFLNKNLKLILRLFVVDIYKLYFCHKIVKIRKINYKVNVICQKMLASDYNYAFNHMKT